jgi:anthranilate synthase component 1
MDIIRAVAFKFNPTSKPVLPYCGLFGAISYDFIDQFEDLPESKEDVLKDPDYELYFLDNLFLIDHKDKKMYLIANALITDANRKAIYERCIKTIEGYEKTLQLKAPKPKKLKPKKQLIETDTEKKEYEDTVREMKSHILQGDVFQVVPSRTLITNYNAEPLDIYNTLRTLNPSPYMFYINSQSGMLIGSSPEMYLRVQGDEQKLVEIRPIAGTKPRGIVNDKIDLELDSRYETELKIDRKELAEHTMLIDLARNDVARISKPGTRITIDPFIVEKYSHVQHLVSTVKGELKEDLDALHAYLASMNMGTLTGAPKIEAMKLIRKAEKTKRGFYGGSVGYLTPNGDFDSCIVIRTMKLKNNKAYIRAGAGIVYDSVPQKEFNETNKKAQSCLRAVKLAGGLK